ncbi:MAG TPA: hypothetical protein VFY06_02690 [Verrucomicrobiae bacterium]|nr:hypothetical protein [Verrucomicrobiae bacterium]
MKLVTAGKSASKQLALWTQSMMNVPGNARLVIVQKEFSCRAVKIV